MARRKKAAKIRTKAAAKKSVKKVVKLKAVKKPAAKAATATVCRGRQRSRGARRAGRSTACAILDFTHVQSGPTCTQLLAYMGADVIKVERPGIGDITRGQLRDVKGADSLYFTMLNGIEALDHDRFQASQGQGNPRSAGEELRRAGGEFRARRARPHGADLGAYPQAQSAHDRRLGERLRPRPLRGLQGL